MQPIRSRLDALERHTDTETAFMVVIGSSPTPEQKIIIAKGKVKLLIEMPDNKRGDYGREQR